MVNLDKKYPNDTGSEYFPPGASAKGGAQRRITTDARKRKFLKALERTDFNLSDAARMAGVSRRIVMEWKAIDPVFKEKMLDVMERQKDFAEGILMRNMRSRHPITSNTAAIFFLKTKCKDRGYIEGQVIEHKGQINHGVLVLPPGPGSISDWERSALAQQGALPEKTQEENASPSEPFEPEAE